MHVPDPDFLALQQAVAGRYSVERELGRGGMGVVFLARDVALDRPVAIKLLPGARAADPAVRERFLREARTAAGLSHPHIVPIHAVEAAGSVVFFVMGYVDGESLGQRVRRAGPLPPAEAVRVLQEVAWALGHAHARGIVHRDVKPDNILLERGTGRALVTDFGIAQVAEASGDTSGIVGTPAYMAPEQAEGRAEPRSDLYALGVTAWFALTGRHPFAAGMAAGLLARHAGEPPPPLAPAAPRVPARVAAAVDRCLAKRPGDRFPDAEALYQELQVARPTEPPLPAPVRAFVRDAVAAGGEMGVALGVGAASVGSYFAFFSQDLFGGIVFLTIGAMGGGLAGARLGQVFGSARDARRQGYDFLRVRAGLRREVQRIEEETAVEDRATRRAIWKDTGLAVGIGVAKAAPLTWLAFADVPTALALGGLAGAIMVTVPTVRRLWSTLRRGRPSLWLRGLGGWFGRTMFWAAGLGIRTPALPPGAGDQPTEVALGGAARALWTALPTDQRRRLPDVPDLVGALEHDAQRLRRAVAAGVPVDARLREAVAALEGLRLDLLRLGAGMAKVEDLTDHLERARSIGHAVDAELAGREEVRRLLAPDPNLGADAT